MCPNSPPTSRPPTELCAMPRLARPSPLKPQPSPPGRHTWPGWHLVATSKTLARCFKKKRPGSGWDRPMISVALPFGRIIGLADAGTAVWNENSGSRNSHLCSNKCELLERWTPRIRPFPASVSDAKKRQPCCNMRARYSQFTGSATATFAFLTAISQINGNRNLLISIK